VLFESVGKEGAQLAGNVMGGRARLALAFGVAPDKLLAEVLRRLRASAQVVEVPREVAPAQQVVLTGDQADLTALPVHLQHGMDGGRMSRLRSTSPSTARAAGPTSACAA